MAYDSVDLLNFKKAFSYQEGKTQHILKEGYNFIIGAILVVLLILVPLHVLLAYAEMQFAHEIFSILEIIAVVFILWYPRLEIFFDFNKKQFAMRKKRLLFSSAQEFKLEEVKGFKVKQTIWGFTQKYTDRISIFALQIKIKDVYQTLLRSITISNGANLFIIADICQQNIEKKKFLPHPVQRQLPFAVKISPVYYIVNFVVFWAIVFCFMLGTGLFFYAKSHDWEVMKMLFSPEILFGYTGLILVLSFFFGYLIKEK